MENWKIVGGSEFLFSAMWRKERQAKLPDFDEYLTHISFYCFKAV